MRLIYKAQTRRGRYIQNIGGIIFFGTGCAVLFWLFGALGTVFGDWITDVGILFPLLIPVIYLAGTFIVWFSTGVFPVIPFILWLFSLIGVVMVVIGGKEGKQNNHTDG